MKAIYTKAIISSLISVQAFANCVPANEYVPFVGVAAKPNDRAGDQSGPPIGSYSRISPDGRYVIRSLSGDHLSTVTVMELRDTAAGGKEAVAYNTGLKLEAFPVQGTWRFVNDTDGSHFLLRDVLQKQKDASRQFRGGIEGFYATAAELPGGTDSSRKIRSLSWPNPDRGEVGLKNIELEFKKNPDGTFSKTSESSRNQMCENLKDSDGRSFSLPMISQDGKEFAAMPTSPKDGKASMRIYEFGQNGKDCVPVLNLGVAASKVIFGFPKDGKKAPITYLGASSMRGPDICRDVHEEFVVDPENPDKFINRKIVPPRRECQANYIPVNGVHVFDRELRRSFFVGDRSNPPVAVDSFPGMTKDGRVVYGAKWNECRTVRERVKSWDVQKADKDGYVEINVQKCELKTGYIISDPNQSEDMKNFRQMNPEWAIGMKQCITKAEVAKVEDDQRLIYGLGARPAAPVAPTDGKR